jgi:serine/threonine transporter
MSVLKKVVEKYNGISLIVRILCGLLIGAVLGLTVPKAAWIALFGDLFVGALKAVAPLLVFVLITAALSQRTAKLDRRFGLVLILYMMSTFLAAFGSVFGSFLFPQKLVLAEAAAADTVPQGIGEVLRNLLLKMVENPVSALVNANYIGVLFWAIILGLAFKQFASDSSLSFLSNASDAVSQAVRWIINLAPFGIMGLVFNTVSTNGLSIFTTYGKLLALLVGCMLFTALIVDPLIACIFLRRNPYPLVLRCLRESGITAFFTRSSAANIPINMALCERLGLD